MSTLENYFIPKSSKHHSSPNFHPKNFLPTKVFSQQMSHQLPKLHDLLSYLSKYQNLKHFKKQTTKLLHLPQQPKEKLIISNTEHYNRSMELRNNLLY